MPQGSAHSFHMYANAAASDTNLHGECVTALSVLCGDGVDHVLTAGDITQHEAMLVTYYCSRLPVASEGVAYVAEAASATAAIAEIYPHIVHALWVTGAAAQL
jgi:hypothetical protein